MAEIDTAFKDQIEQIRKDHYSDDGPDVGGRRARFHHSIGVLFTGNDEVDDDEIAEQVRADNADHGLDFMHLTQSPTEKLVCIQVKDGAKLTLAKQRNALQQLMGGVQSLQLKKSNTGLSDTRKQHHKSIRKHGDKPIDYVLVLTGVSPAANHRDVSECVAVMEPHSVRVIDRKELHRLWNQTHNPPACTVTLRWREADLLQSGPNSTPIVLMGWLPCTDFVSATRPHGNALFRMNPRLSLEKSKPNKAMERTLSGTGDTDKTDKKVFHLLNNGLTAFCDLVRMKQVANGFVEYEFTNFQIVNGCQTTTTLWRVTEDAVADAWISLRVIEGDKKLGGMVSKCTNSQSAITDADQRANDDCQRRIKNCLENAPDCPIFYEARRGEWAACKEKLRFQGKVEGGRKAWDAKITMKELAQALLSVIGEPYKAKEQIVSIFKEENSTYGELFEKSWTDSAQLLLIADLFRYVSVLGNWIDPKCEDHERQIARLGRYMLTLAAYEYMKHSDNTKQMFEEPPFALMSADRSREQRVCFPATIKPVLVEAHEAICSYIAGAGGDSRSALRGKVEGKKIQTEIRKQIRTWERATRRSE